MEKTYILRKVAYHYSDEYHYFHSIGGIENIFHSKEEATNELIRLERESLEKLDLGNIEQLSICSPNFLKEAKSFKYYCKVRFGEDLVKVDEAGNIYCERGTMLPKKMSDSEILDIRRVLGIKFHELTSYNDEPFFFGIWVNARYDNEPGYYSFNDVPYFFNTYLEAIKEAKRKLPGIFMNKKIEGELEEITNTPFLLKSLIAGSSEMEFDKDQKILRIKYVKEEEAIALNELIKEKAFEIRKMTIEEVKNFDHNIYEIM